MLSVISPAKTLNPDTPSYDCSTIPAFLDEAATLNKALRRLKAADLESLMNISPKLSALNRERNLAWSTPFTTDNAQPAIHAFKGEVYMKLGAETLDSDDLAFAQDNLRILSGLYGILRPLDLMQPYRLEMGTGLKSKRGDNLYEFWDTRIAAEINRVLDHQKSGSRTLVNLASNEYFKAVSPGHLNADIITPVFKERKGDAYRVVAILAKRARGLMARYIITGRITSPEALKSFDVDGYAYNAELSDATNWIFTRDQS